MRHIEKKRALALFNLFAPTLIVALFPVAAFADFRGSLENIRSQLSGVVLPLLSVIGLLVASFSYMTGHPDSKRHVSYALIGAALGFGSQAIIDFISSAIR
jgi:type IV secretory pathway VirB2 component (pilin)